MCVLCDTTSYPKKEADQMSVHPAVLTPASAQRFMVWGLNLGHYFPWYMPQPPYKIIVFPQ